MGYDLSYSLMLRTWSTLLFPQTLLSQGEGEKKSDHLRARRFNQFLAPRGGVRDGGKPLLHNMSYSEQEIERKGIVDNISLIGMVSMIVAGLTIAVGSIAPALGEARALTQALASIAQQPDEAGTITRTLFVGLAMVESTAIYCFVVTMILIFANPFWNQVVGP